MITDTLKEIEAARAKLAALESDAAAEINSELAALPARYGFETAKAFIKAVKAAGRRSTAAPEKKVKAGKKVRSRAKITDATRAEVKKLTQAGKTGAEIAAAVGISLPSVQNVRKALGLVKKRK